MKDENKTKDQLIHEINELRSQNAQHIQSYFVNNHSSDYKLDDRHSYTENIFETLRDPILLLDKELRILQANRSFYTTFKTTSEETLGSFVYDLKNKQWDIPKLREFLEEIIPEKQSFDDFEISHDFRDIGHKVMLLNAREIYVQEIDSRIILLAFEDITEHKRLEDLLSDSEERYRRLFETANDGIVLLEKEEGKITHANPAFEKMLGYNKMEVINRGLQNIVVLPDSYDFQTRLHVLNNEGIIKFDDVPIRTKSGQHIDTEIYLVDRAKLMQCNIREVSERKRQEEELRRSEMKFRTLYESTSDAVMLEDETGFFDCNEATLTIFGCRTKEELYSKSPVDLSPAEQPDGSDSKEMAKQLFASALEKGSHHFEWTHIRVDTGEIFPAHVLLTAMELDSRTVLQAVVRDITEYKQKEETLRQSGDYYRAIFETAGTSMLILEKDTTIAQANSNFEKLSSYSRQELEGKKYGTDFIHPDDVEWMKEYHAIRQQDPHAVTPNYEFRFLNRNGETRYGYLTVGMIPHTTQSVISIVDITDRKEAEEELQTAHDKLNTLVQLNADGLMVLNQEGNILFLNPAAAQMLGREQEELWGAQFGHPLIPGLSTEIELLSNSGDARVVELRGRETEWGGQSALLASFRDITERKKFEEKIYNLAFYDELTALPNRRLFVQQLEQAIARSEGSDNGGVVFKVDIARLREVNDTLGQQAGDELIVDVAQRIGNTVFEEDIVARLSGGEFKILSEGRDNADKAQDLGWHILQGIGEKLELSGRLVYPEVNIGFTLFPQRGTDPEILMQQANMALNEAKKNASSIQEFDWQEDRVSRQFHLEHDLKQALANEEFRIYYQTQMDLRTGRTVGVEALLRWEHLVKGVVSPGEFIPALEHTGMIVSVDEWVIRKVCEQLGTWQKQGIPVKTAANLSAQQFRKDTIIEVVRRALDENGVHVHNLEIEVTETGLMENVDRASRILQTFSNWGVRVALDDFGTGYSSLSYLQRLAINTIKIDKQFVDGLPEDADSVSLVQTIISMAHNLGKEVLAEGVEREEQRQKLVELGCDYGQGFLWSRPQPVESLVLSGNLRSVQQHSNESL